MQLCEMRHRAVAFDDARGWCPACDLVEQLNATERRLADAENERAELAARLDDAESRHASRVVREVGHV